MKQLQRGAQPPSDVVELETIRLPLKAFEDAVAATKAADRHLAQFQRSGRHTAEREDAEKLAASIEAGEKPPKATAVERFEREFAEAQRQTSTATS